MNTVAWLIESTKGSPIYYFCGDGDWCTNPNHAIKFKTKEAAEEKANIIINKTAVVDHMWIDNTDDAFDRAKQAL